MLIFSVEHESKMGLKIKHLKKRLGHHSHEVKLVSTTLSVETKNFLTQIRKHLVSTVCSLSTS